EHIAAAAAAVEQGDAGGLRRRLLRVPAVERLLVAAAEDHARQAAQCRRELLKQRDVIERGERRRLILDALVGRDVQKESEAASGAVLGEPAHLGREIRNGARIEVANPVPIHTEAARREALALAEVEERGRARAVQAPVLRQRKRSDAEDERRRVVDG